MEIANYLRLATRSLASSSIPEQCIPFDSYNLVLYCFLGNLWIFILQFTKHDRPKNRVCLLFCNSLSQFFEVFYPSNYLKRQKSQPFTWSWKFGLNLSWHEKLFNVLFFDEIIENWVFLLSWISNSQIYYPLKSKPPNFWNFSLHKCYVKGGFFSERGLMRLSFLQTDKPHYFPELEFWFLFHCKLLKSC